MNEVKNIPIHICKAMGPFDPIVSIGPEFTHCPHCGELIKREKNMVKEFMELCDKMKEIHVRKNADYAKATNPFDNFEKAAQLQSWFTSDIDKVFAGLVAVKLARLSNLLNTGNLPQNESIDDSFLDLTVYCGLWASYYKSHKLVGPNQGTPLKEQNPYHEKG